MKSRLRRARCRCTIVRVGFWQNRFFADFYFWAAGFFADFVAGFLLLIFVGKSAQKNPPGKSPAKSSNISTTKIPDSVTHFCRGAGPKVVLCPFHRSRREICTPNRPVSETNFLDDFWGPFLFQPLYSTAELQNWFRIITSIVHFLHCCIACHVDIRLHYIIVFELSYRLCNLLFLHDRIGFKLP